MDLFRAVVSKEEYSERVLELTEELLELNAANYTIWLEKLPLLPHFTFHLSHSLANVTGCTEETA